MSKINIDEVPPALQAFKLPDVTIKGVLAHLEKVLQELKDAKGTAKKKKNQYVIVIPDPEGKLAGLELTGWVTQIQEDQDTGTVLDKILAGIREFNASKKGQKNPIKSLGEGIAHVTRKFFTNQKVQLKHKEPVRVLITDNKL